MWPFSKRGEDVRNDINASDAVIEGLLDRARGIAVRPEELVAVETALGIWQRAFSSATVSESFISPSLMGIIALELGLRGEFVGDLADGGLQPVNNWELSGSPNPDSWVYSIEKMGPSTGIRGTRSARQVVHVRINTRASSPWKGRAPLTTSRDTQRVAAHMERLLADDLAGPHGRLVIVQGKMAEGRLGKLADRLGQLKGGTAVFEGPTGMSGGNNTPRNMGPLRLGAEPPQTLDLIRQHVDQDVLGVFGIPPGLTATQSGASREAFRQLLHSTLSPLGIILAAEFSAKLGRDVSISWDRLNAADIAAKARAYGVLVNAGMDQEEAATVTGLE